MKCVKGLGFLWVAVLAAIFALSACDDSSSAGDDDNNVILSGDSREESSDSRSNDKDEAISSSGKVTDKDSDAKSSDSKDSPSSAGTSTKSSNSNSSGTTTKSSNSSAGKVNCSALLEGWSWDVPKECRFNPDIDYGSMTDERDGKVYRTMIKHVGLHDQVWMAENLNYADSVKTPSLLKRNWCYNDEPANCDVGGRLYTWAAAIDSVKLATDADNPQVCGYGKTCTLSGKVQGICPNGWHLPTYDEWITLFTYSSGVTNGSMDLRSQTGWYDNGNGWDTYGFSALPAGSRDDNGDFNGAGEGARFWNATQAKEYYSYGTKMYYRHNDVVGPGYFDKSYALSIRCLMDSE